ncbi:MAG TPA: molecular chaperone DnaJ [Erysipelotrichaceae bacterium]|nr:molecular chaperone DnaJ [Erysipelotrichaceae bacterium]
MAEKRDLYEILGIKKSASKDAIKSAYRKLAKKYHPDNKETGNEHKFKEVQEAYDILYDDQKRSAYDQFGFAAFEQGAGAPGSNPFEGGFGFSSDTMDFGDIFSSFFGGGSRRTSRASSGPRRGNDTIIRAKVNFMDTILGRDIEIPLSVDENCSSCNGTGAKSPSDIQTCPQCNGRGYVTTQRRSLFGMIEQEEVCPRCDGKGKIILNSCPRCNGRGFNRVKKNVKVHVIAGINNGQQIRVQGMGGRGINGGKNGDLFVEINIKPHEFFKRDGNDIHLDLPIDFFDAILGVTVDVPTVYGEASLNIPSGIQPGQTLRMRGQGVKDLRTGKPGDQYVHLDVKMPSSLNRQQKDLLKQYRESIKKDDSSLEKFKKKFKN